LNKTGGQPEVFGIYCPVTLSSLFKLRKRGTVVGEVEIIHS
jgi:hypothetical protein